MFKNTIKNYVTGLLFVSITISNYQIIRADDTAEYAELFAGCAKFPTGLYTGKFAEEILWASRATHAGLALHNKPNDRQHHNKFWLFFSLVNLSALLAERASTLSIFSGFSGVSPEELELQELEQLAAKTDKHDNPDQVKQDIKQDAKQDIKEEELSFQEKIKAYLKSSPLLALARATILPALESGLAVYCATNRDNTPIAKRNRARAQALCSIVMMLSEYVKKHPESLESDIYLAFVYLSVLKACDDFFVYDPIAEQQRERAHIAAEAARRVARAARRPARAYLVDVGGENRVAIRRNGAQVLDPMNAECPICQEDFDVRDNFGDEEGLPDHVHDRVAIFACNHAMCDGCYAGRNIERRNDCPTCRAPRDRARERVVRLREDGDDTDDADEVDLPEPARPGRRHRPENPFLAGDRRAQGRRAGSHRAFQPEPARPHIAVEYDLPHDLRFEDFPGVLDDFPGNPRRPRQRR